MSLATFVLFYLMTVFTLSWGTSALGYTREKFLLMQLFAILFFALTIPLSARCSPNAAAAPMLMWVNVGIGAVRPGAGAAVRGRHDGRGGDDGARACR